MITRICFKKNPEVKEDVNESRDKMKLATQCLNLSDGYIGFIILFYFYNVEIFHIKNVVYIDKLLINKTYTKF